MEDITTLSTLELARARVNASAILEELQLDAYIYEVEPHEGDWERVRNQWGLGNDQLESAERHVIGQ